ncbi:hypothetical protein [Pseudoalteromonas mariniglutinosa]|uniref:hypothetical protein n=1 Tax=Pseudoalteromonas mariniglutinosa TaxID=206042 RepID=UPI00384B4984
MHAQFVNAERVKSRTKAHNKQNFSVAYRFAVVARFLAAIVGGYIFTSIFISLLSLLLPLSKLDSVLLSTTLSIAIYSCVFIWVFAVKSLAKVWIIILLTCVGQAICLALLKGWL